MSCKSALFGANTASQTVATGGVINFGSVVRRYGCNCNLSGGNVVLTGVGYYDLDTNFTFIPSAVGTVTIQLYKDGVAITGASASETVASGDTYTMNISGMVRETCNCESTLTAIITGATATFSNASIAVEKI